MHSSQDLFLKSHSKQAAEINSPQPLGTYAFLELNVKADLYRGGLDRGHQRGTLQKNMTITMRAIQTPPPSPFVPNLMDPPFHQPDQEKKKGGGGAGEWGQVQSEYTPSDSNL